MTKYFIGNYMICFCIAAPVTQLVPIIPHTVSYPSAESKYTT